MFKIGSVLSALCVGLFAVYLGNTVYSLYNLFHPETCNKNTEGECIYVCFLLIYYSFCLIYIISAID